MTIYIYANNHIMYHNKENCKAAIEQDFFDYEWPDFLSSGYAEDVRRAIICLVYGGSAKDSDVQKLCDDYTRTLEDYIDDNMAAVEVDDEMIEIYERKNIWGD